MVLKVRPRVEISSLLSVASTLTVKSPSLTLLAARIRELIGLAIWVETVKPTQMAANNRSKATTMKIITKLI